MASLLKSLHVTLILQKLFFTLISINSCDTKDALKVNKEGIPRSNLQGFDKVMHGKPSRLCQALA
jgi:hypothetical protein